MRAVLIGGTSNVGKSSVARVVADALGFDCRSTDTLARHPGRPWRTPEKDVPPHVAEHYSTLGTDELIAAVLAHYERLWPRIADLLAARVADPAAPGLVLEGSALWPARVARLGIPHTATVWLTADVAVLAGRMHAASGYATATAAERLLVDRFLARTARYQERMRSDVDGLGLAAIDTGGRSVTEVAEAVLAVLGR